MKIFKFGGASVKDADGIKNVYSVLEKVGHEDTLLVISAMGKTTNALEVVIKNYFDIAYLFSGVLVQSFFIIINKMKTI